MNNDLISREALKKVFENLASDDYNEPIWYQKTVFETIDSAPTVEPFEPDYVGAERLKARQRGYEQGYHFGMKIGKTLNPKIKQGEWKSEGGFVFCNQCGSSHGVHKTNFCSNCGADMRGSE